MNLIFFRWSGINQKRTEKCIDLQLQLEVGHVIFDDKNCNLKKTVDYKKNIKWLICLITGMLIKFSTYTISKIFRKVIIAHTRLWGYINVVYKSQKCKCIHLIDAIDSTSIYISKKCCDSHEFREMNFLLPVEMLLCVIIPY